MNIVSETQRTPVYSNPRNVMLLIIAITGEIKLGKRKIVEEEEEEEEEEEKLVEL